MDWSGLSQLTIMSDVSTDMSSSDEEERRTKSVARIPELPEPVRVAAPEVPSLTQFWESNPTPAMDVNMTTAELEERLAQAEQIGEFLKKQNDDLQEQYKAEWIAKERLLDEVFRKQLGSGAPIMD